MENADLSDRRRIQDIVIKSPQDQRKKKPTLCSRYPKEGKSHSKTYGWMYDFGI